MLEGIYMLQQLLPHSESLKISCSSANEAIETINTYIKNYSCENMSVDISFMNVIDACYVSTLCSTQHYIKYPQGKINWKISSELVKEFNKDLELGNCCYTL